MSSKKPAPSRTDTLHRLFELAASQAGYFTAAQARDLTTGLVSPTELRAAVKRRSARVPQLVNRAIEEAGVRA